MRRLFLALSLVHVLYSTHAQNLVLNSSFEDHTFCVTFGNQWLDWPVVNWDITPSCDYFHPCGSSVNNVSVPDNFAGFQYAHSGLGYVGAYFFSPPWQDTDDHLHENLIGRLSKPLQADSFYRVSLFVSLAESSQIACDCIEVFLSTNYPPVNSPIVFGRIDATPQLRNSPIVTDTIGWTEVCWLYRAEGGERFLTIGNFRPNTEVTDTVRLPQNLSHPYFSVITYYYFDDVTVEKVPYHLASTELPPDRAVCPGEALHDTLVVGGFYDNFLWSTGDTTRSIVVSGPGTYTVDAWQGTCRWTEEVVYGALPALEADLGPDTAFCPGNSLQLSVEPGFDEYLWSTGDTLNSITVDSFGQYWVEATYECGTFRDTVTVGLPEELTVTLPPDTTLQLGRGLQIVPQIGGEVESLTWMPEDFLDCTDCAKPHALPLHDLTYFLEARDVYGCRAIDSMHIEVVNPAKVYTPSAFSPNGDGVNDVFTIYGGPEVAQVEELLIFQRWGGLVYRQENLSPSGNAGWDGTRNGSPLDPGVYVYLARVRYLDGREAWLSGEVVLVR